jgi:hypothetical protein
VAGGGSGRRGRCTSHTARACPGCTDHVLFACSGGRWATAWKPAASPVSRTPRGGRRGLGRGCRGGRDGAQGDHPVRRESPQGADLAAQSVSASRRSGAENHAGRPLVCRGEHGCGRTSARDLIAQTRLSGADSCSVPVGCYSQIVWVGARLFVHQNADSLRFGAARARARHRRGIPDRILIHCGPATANARSCRG